MLLFCFIVCIGFIVITLLQAYCIIICTPLGCCCWIVLLEQWVSVCQYFFWKEKSDSNFSQSLLFQSLFFRAWALLWFGNKTQLCWTIRSIAHNDVICLCIRFWFFNFQLSFFWFFNCKLLIVNYFQKPTSYCKKNFQKYLRNSKKKSIFAIRKNVPFGGVF